MMVERRRLVDDNPRRKWPWLLGIAIAVLIPVGLLVVTGTRKPEAPIVVPPSTSVRLTPTGSATANVPVRTATSLTGPLTEFGPGVWEVGVDVVAGKYKTLGPKDGAVSCSWARYARSKGLHDELLAQNSTEGPATVVIRSTDGTFDTRGCQNWVRVGP